ncbi:MAG: hypothetical protein AMXMBFR58_20270 [Phycisphaerae bacterium]
MKGTPERQAAVYHTFNVEDLIEAGHPLRPIKRMVDLALAEMSRTFKAGRWHHVHIDLQTRPVPCHHLSALRKVMS